jgi:hypothetical protein
MIFALFDVRSTFQLGVELCASRAENRGSRFEVGPRHHRSDWLLRGHWHVDSMGALVCVWRSEPRRPLVKPASGVTPT